MLPKTLSLMPVIISKKGRKNKLTSVIKDTASSDLVSAQRLIS